MDDDAKAMEGIFGCMTAMAALVTCLDATGALPFETWDELVRDIASQQEMVEDADGRLRDRPMVVTMERIATLAGDMVRQARESRTG